MKQTHIAYGFITGIIMAIVSLTIYLTGLAFKSGMQWISYVPFLIGVILNALAFSKANDGHITFQNAFCSCFKASMIVAIVMVAWAIITIIVFPEMKEKVIDLTRERMSKNQQTTDEQMEVAINFVKKGWNVMVISSAVLYTLFFGLIFSLIGAAVTKKNRELPLTDRQN